MSGTVRDLLLRQARSERAALRFEDLTWSWQEYVGRAGRLCHGVNRLLDDTRPRHVGALLDNVPDMALLLAGAGLGGFTLVGLNTTRRGAGLAADIRRSDCQVVVTDPAHAHLLEGLGAGVEVLDISSAQWAEVADEPGDGGATTYSPTADDLMMLIFTSGTSGEPKAVRITHEKVAHPGQLLAERFGLGPDDVCYLSMPLFHSNAVMAGFAPALAAGATMALARRFSASGFLTDVRRYGATYANYVGKPLTYVLATPEQPDDAENPLRLAFGNEAAERDIEAFGRRFGCTVVDSYSSTENAVIVQRTPDMPAGALGRPLPGVKVLDPATGEEVPVAELDADGRLRNADAAIGELVNTTGPGFFAGYYNDPVADAERMRAGMYWSGDLAYRDADGFVHFAGRSSEWLRVDGENLAAAPIEQALHRHPDVLQAAVYAVPDESGVGDQVMAALVLRPGRRFDPAGFEEFLDAQRDLGAKSRPRYVRVAGALPQTPTNKILKRSLRAQGVTGHPDPVWSRAERATSYTAEPAHPASAALVELAYDGLDDRDEVPAGVLGDPALPLVGRTPPGDVGDGGQLVGAAQPVAHRRQPLEQVVQVVPQQPLVAVGVGDDPGVEAVTRRPPLVLLDIPGRQAGQGLSRHQPVLEVHHETVGERHESTELAHGGHAVAHPHLEGAQARRRADVPADLADLLDDAGLHLGRHEPFELRPGLELERQARGGQLLEHHRPVGGVAGVEPGPDRRGRRERLEVRVLVEQRAQHGHHVVGVPDPDVHVHAPDEHLPPPPLRPGDELLVAVPRRQLLLRPLGEGVCAGGEEVDAQVSRRRSGAGRACGAGRPSPPRRAAHTGDDLDGVAQQLLVQPRTAAGDAGALPHAPQQVVGGVHQVA